MKSLTPNPVAWLEGMFLRPQHLQQHDHYWDTRFGEQLRSLDPFHWGVRCLEVNEEALSDHRFEVLRLEAVLPGGTPLCYPGGCTLEMREFKPTEPVIDVWMGLRRPNPGEPQSAPLEDGSRGVRYRVRGENVPDLNRGGAEASVDFLVPNVRLFLSGESGEPGEPLELEQHDVFRLARVVATGELRRPFALARDYAPPLLSIQAFAPLEAEIQKIVSQLASRIRVVAGRTHVIAIADLPRMWLRYTLARMTAVLRHLTSTGATRPFDLYGALVETAAALGAFALSEPAELPRYDHEDLYPCFQGLLRFIDEKLEEVVPHRFREFEMRFERTAYITQELSLELANPRNHFFIGIKAAIDSLELTKLVQEYGKCAARAELGSILMLNLGGLRLEPLSAAPADIAARLGFQYWKLEPHGKLWTQVRSDGSLALSLGKLQGADVRLYVVSEN
jgi:type VI secretion system protein ImpJ